MRLNINQYLCIGMVEFFLVFLLSVAFSPGKAERENGRKVRVACCDWTQRRWEMRGRGPRSGRLGRVMGNARCGVCVGVRGVVILWGGRWMYKYTSGR